MKLISLELSPAQKSKLRNLESIKISKKYKSMNGTGVNLLVDEDTYNHMSRRFDTNKGLMFKLSSSEIEANKDLEKIDDDEVKEVMSGSGLFRHKKKQ